MLTQAGWQEDRRMIGCCWGSSLAHAFWQDGSHLWEQSNTKFVFGWGWGKGCLLQAALQPVKHVWAHRLGDFGQFLIHCSVHKGIHCACVGKKTAAWPTVWAFKPVGLGVGNGWVGNWLNVWRQGEYTTNKSLAVYLRNRINNWRVRWNWWRRRRRWLWSRLSNKL